MKWGDRHYPTPGGPPRLTLHAGCGGNIGPDLRCDRCGKHAARGEIELPPGPGAPHGEHAEHNVSAPNREASSAGGDRLFERLSEQRLPGVTGMDAARTRRAQLSQQAGGAAVVA